MHSPNAVISVLLCATGLSVHDVAAQDNGEPAKKKWNANAVQGPAKKIELTLEEGTWMNLDVSPDGKTIAFLGLQNW